jgi:chaperonin GroES
MTFPLLMRARNLGRHGRQDNSVALPRRTAAATRRQGKYVAGAALTPPDTATICAGSLALAIAECQRSHSSSKKEAHMKFRPLHDRVLVRRIEAEAKTAGGIIIPDTAKEKPQEGEVISVGSGTLNDKGELRALDVKAGDRILFGKWSGTEVKLNGEELLIMKESDIMGILA